MAKKVAGLNSNWANNQEVCVSTTVNGYLFQVWFGYRQSEERDELCLSNAVFKIGGL